MEITKAVISEFLQNNKLEFKSTHKRLSLPIINRIYKKMKHQIKFEDIKVYENLIINGHHRYISSELAKFSIGKSEYIKTSAKLEYNWNVVEFVDEDWDTQHKIHHINQLDAEYNNIPIEQINDIIR